ncbi:Hypothetical predicted protein, partial [Marmota monax]
CGASELRFQVLASLDPAYKSQPQLMALLRPKASLLAPSAVQQVNLRQLVAAMS